MKNRCRNCSIYMISLGFYGCCSWKCLKSLKLLEKKKLKIAKIAKIENT